MKWKGVFLTFVICTSPQLNWLFAHFNNSQSSDQRKVSSSSSLFARIRLWQNLIRYPLYFRSCSVTFWKFLISYWHPTSCILLTSSHHVPFILSHHSICWQNHHCFDSVLTRASYFLPLYFSHCSVFLYSLSDCGFTSLLIEYCIVNSWCYSLHAESY